MSRTSRVWNAPRRSSKRRPKLTPATAPAPVDAARARTWRINLGYERPPLSLNHRRHWRQRYELEYDLKELVMWQCKRARIPQQTRQIRVELIWEHLPDHRARDRDNVVATLKPVIDGLRLAGVIADDTDDHVTYGAPRIQESNRKAVVLVVHGHQ